jgi:hypothetical protein
VRFLYQRTVKYICRASPGDARQKKVAHGAGLKRRGATFAVRFTKLHDKHKTLLCVLRKRTTKKFSQLYLIHKNHQTSLKNSKN